MMSQSNSEHGHRKIIAILDVAIAFFNADMDEVICAHPPREDEPDRAVVRDLHKAPHGTRKAARLRQEMLRSETFMKGELDAVFVVVHHKVGRRCERRAFHVFQDANAMLEPSKLLAIIGPSQGTEAKIMKRFFSWSPAGSTWKANVKHALTSAGSEQLRAAAHTPGTAAIALKRVALGTCSRGVFGWSTATSEIEKICSALGGCAEARLAIYFPATKCRRNWWS